MIFETHAHYDDEAFDRDRQELLDSMEANGIGRIINVAADMESCRTTLALSEKHPFIYAALGIHPSGTGELTEERVEWLTELVRKNSVRNSGKVAAVGEIGLDYYWDENPEKEIQKKWFERQMKMAEEVKLPLIIHSREAARDTFDMISGHPARKNGGIIHCYAYSKEMARDYLSMGFYFGIGGVITFKNARKLKEVVEFLPMDSIVLETDSPYLSPVPNRGKRNSSLNLHYIAEEIGRIKGIETERVVEITRRNAQKLFGIS